MGAKPGIWTPNEELRLLIEQRGGPVPVHGHFERAFTSSLGNYKTLGSALLPAKWELTDDLKRLPEYRTKLPQRLRMAVELMRSQGCTAARTYIDADSIIGLYAVERALLLKDELAKDDFFLQIVASPRKILRDQEDRAVFLEACHIVDVVGGLPSRDRGDNVYDFESSRRGMRDLFEIAVDAKKPIDMQIDQDNHPHEIESKLFVEIAEEYRRDGYQQSITAVHCISMAAWFSEAEIAQVAHNMYELDISVVVCPSAGLSNKQHRDVLAPTHNSIAPIPYLLKAGVNVAFGVDNICDYPYMAFANGNIEEEMRLMLHAIRWQGPLEPIADMMTVNGRKVLGI